METVHISSSSDGSDGGRTELCECELQLAKLDKMHSAFQL